MLISLFPILASRPSGIRGESFPPEKRLRASVPTLTRRPEWEASADGTPKSKALGGKLVCVGDSITEGALSTKPEFCYVGRIQSLASETHRDLQVVNAGISGWTTGAFASNAVGLSEKLPADATVITIMLGTNDARSVNAPEEIARAAASNLEKIMKTYHEKASNAEFVIVTPPAAYPSKFTDGLRRAHYDETVPEKLKAIDEAYKSLAKRLRLRFIDISKLPGEDHSPDGVHPDDAGHEKLAKTIWRKLNGR